MLTGLFGAVAGAASVFGNTPLDVIKTRMQVCSGFYRALSELRLSACHLHHVGVSSTGTGSSQVQKHRGLRHEDHEARRPHGVSTTPRMMGVLRED